MSTDVRLDRRAIRAVDEALAAVHLGLRVAGAALAEGRDADASTAPADAAFDRLAALAGASGLGALYLPRIDEMRLERDVLFERGDARREASARRYGGAAERLFVDGRARSIGALAESFATELPVPDDSEPVADPVAALLAYAESFGIPVRVRIEPSLVADAATGDRTLFLAARPFRARELLRLAVHEIGAHLVASANARAQPLALLRVGTCGSWEDQEGLALVLEEQARVFDGTRRRRIGARALAALVFLAGGDARDASDRLRGLGLPEEVVTVAVRRAFRGGGSARDLAYLRGYGRVSSAIGSGDVTIDELRIGRVAIAALPSLAALRPAGLVRPPVHRPSLRDSLLPTLSGTSFPTSPPSRAASFTRFDET